MRERMEQHRANPVCATCHKIFEPIGLALENFDAVGTWRTKDEGVPIDPSGVLVDGTTVNGVASLRDVLVRYSGSVRAGRDREAADLRAGPRGRISRYAAGAIDRARRGGSNYRFSSLVLGIVKSAPFQMNTKRTRQRRNRRLVKRRRQPSCLSRRSTSPGAPSCAARV